MTERQKIKIVVRERKREREYGFKTIGRERYERDYEKEHEGKNEEERQ